MFCVRSIFKNFIPSFIWFAENYVRKNFLHRIFLQPDLCRLCVFYKWFTFCNLLNWNIMPIKNFFLSPVCLFGSGRILRRNSKKKKISYAATTRWFFSYRIFATAVFLKVYIYNRNSTGLLLGSTFLPTVSLSQAFFLECTTYVFVSIMISLK